MVSPPTAPAVTVATHPIHNVFAPFPLVCFTLALITDIAFWRTSNLMWQNFSSWLLLGGLVFGAIAILVGVLELVFRARVRVRGAGWAYAFGYLIILCLALINSLVHAGDGWTAVVPNGLILSVATVLLMFLTFWLWPSPVVYEETEVRRHV